MVESSAFPPAATSGEDEAALPDLDVAALEAQTFGDAALARELLRLFERQCGLLGPILLGATTAPGERREAAHKLKGAALAVGARRLSARAEQVERAEHGTVAGDDALREAIAGALTAVRTQLSA